MPKRPQRPLPPDEDEESPAERPRQQAPPAAQGSQVVPAVLVLAFFGGLAVGAFFLARHLAAPAKPAERAVASAPPKPTASPEAVGKKDKDSVEPKPPIEATPVEVKPPVEAKPPFEVKLPPEPVGPRPLQPLNLDGPISDLYVGGGGRYLVFQQSAPRQFVVYDVAAAKVLSTVPAADQNGRVAVGREKMFVGRSSDGRIIRYDLRTGAQELIGGPKPPERLNHIAIGSDSDGPLVTGSYSADNRYQARLYDTATLAPIEVPIDDPTRKDGPRGFPFTNGTGAAHIAVSGDGRAISLSDRLYTRTATGYSAAPINPSSGLRPSPNGTALLGNSLWDENGQVIRFDDIRTFWLLPAANGPFFVCVDYGRQPVRLTLHADRETKPLGELPVPDDLTDLFQRNAVFPSELHRRLAFLPEPGLVVFVAPGSRKVQFLPVDLPALLAKAGRDVMFTSVPPAAVPKDRPYTYTATGITRDGARPKFELEAGPPGMTVTADGKLAWSPDAAFREPTADVRLIARAGDKQTVQQFRLFLPAK
jgi:hypothetical protein